MPPVPTAQGQATTSTARPINSARSNGKCCAQYTDAPTPSMRMIGTNTPTMLSARRWLGLRQIKRIPHRSTDLRPAGRVCHAAALDQERAVKIDAAGDHMRSEALGDLPAFAGDHGLVGVRFALFDHAVDGNALPRPNPHQRTGADLAHRPAVLSVANNDGRPLAFRRQERLQVTRRPCTPDGVEIVAHGEQHQHHGGRIEVNVRAALDGGESGIKVGGADAERRSAPRRSGAPPCRGATSRAETVRRE